MCHQTCDKVSSIHHPHHHALTHIPTSMSHNAFSMCSLHPKYIYRKGVQLECSFTRFNTRLSPVLQQEAKTQDQKVKKNIREPNNKYIQSFYLLQYGCASLRILDPSSLCHCPHKIHLQIPPRRESKSLSENKPIIHVIL